MQRNFEFETLFHVAARYNSLASLKVLLGRTIFVEELLKKDWKGDTPLHTALTNGSLEMAEFLLSSVTPNFLLLQNDCGQTPVQALQERIRVVTE